jgi:tetratricopeptide (TPR) repeat protein
MIKLINMNLKSNLFMLFLAGTSLFTSEVYSQRGIDDGSRFGHGEDSIRCLRNISLYREYARQKLYKDALPYWRMAFKECPKASKNIYIDGAKIIKYYIGKEKDENIKSALVDTLMLIYDQRIEYYNDKCNVRGRQGVDLLRYRRYDDLEYMEQGYNYLKESMDLCKNKTSEAVLATLISASITLCQNEQISNEQVFEDYLRSIDILNSKLKKDTGDMTIISLKEDLTENFTSKQLCNCDILIPVFRKRMEKDPDNIEDLKTITTVLKKSNCTDSDLFFKASKNLHKTLPSAESAENIAVMAFIKDKYEEAIRYYNHAIKLETDSLKKAGYYLGLAKSNYKLKNPQRAKNFALKAINLNKNWGEPYLLIGQLYAESKDDLAAAEECLPKAAYWFAVDKFIEAKKIDSNVESEANKLISTYSIYFPSIEDAFFCGIKEGDTYNVRLWINETTVARF